MMPYQRGITLVELLIALTLGLLITAAATRVLISSSQGSAAQIAGSSLVSDESFSITPLEDSLLMAGYGAQAAPSTPIQSGYVATDITPFGPIVLSSVAGLATDLAEVNLLVNSSAISDTANTASLSNLASNSDQLVTQRMVPAGTTDLINCEGERVPLPAGYDPIVPLDATAGVANQPRFLVERYFVREDAIARPGEPSPNGLACAAGTYFYDATAGNFVFSAASNKADLESASGALLMSRVDHFKVLLGVNSSTDAATSTATNSTRYMSIDEYIGLTEDAALGPAGKPRIVAVKVGVVTRSSGAGSTTDTPTNFTVLGEDFSLDEADRYVRQVIEKTFLLRNARGWNS